MNQVYLIYYDDGIPFAEDDLIEIWSDENDAQKRIDELNNEIKQKNQMDKDEHRKKCNAELKVPDNNYYYQEWEVRERNLK